jgi:hypothetical protein
LLAHDVDADVKMGTAIATGWTAEVVEALVRDPDPRVRECVAASAHDLSGKALVTLVSDIEQEVRRAVVVRRSLPEWLRAVDLTVFSFPEAPGAGWLAAGSSRWCIWPTGASTFGRVALPDDFHGVGVLSGGRGDELKWVTEQGFTQRAQIAPAGGSAMEPLPDLPVGRGRVGVAPGDRWLGIARQRCEMWALYGRDGVGRGWRQVMSEIEAREVPVGERIPVKPASLERWELGLRQVAMGGREI